MPRRKFVLFFKKFARRQEVQMANNVSRQEGGYQIKSSEWLRYTSCSGFALYFSYDELPVDSFEASKR